MSGLASNARATSRSPSVSFGGRPPLRPARRAAARPVSGLCPLDRHHPSRNSTALLPLASLKSRMCFERVLSHFASNFSVSACLSQKPSFFGGDFGVPKLLNSAPKPDQSRDRDVDCIPLIKRPTIRTADRFQFSLGLRCATPESARSKSCGSMSFRKTPVATPRATSALMGASRRCGVLL
jgi:hypothetical protein